MRRFSLATDQKGFLPLDRYPDYQFDTEGIPMKNFGEALGWQYEPILPIYFAQEYLRLFKLAIPHSLLWGYRLGSPFGKGG